MAYLTSLNYPFVCISLLTMALAFLSKSHNASFLQLLANVSPEPDGLRVYVRLGSGIGSKNLPAKY